MSKLILNSYAKLNLYLGVFNKRKDAYHNIKTIFERINLADKIILEARRRDKKIKIICDSEGLPEKNSRNLAYRSAKLLQDSLKVNQGIEIRIIKHIPVGSGLGGGSSNAATVLLGLNKLWKLNLSRKKLVDFAKKIGSDVPFFIYNCPFAQGEGRGDKIKPLMTAGRVRLWHILAVPEVRVPTPRIYKEWDAYSGLTKAKLDVKILTLALRKKDPGCLGKFLFNSLQMITSKLYPQVEEIREKLARLGLKAILMSGSGPAMFGIVSSRKEAVSLSRELKRENRSWQVFVTRTV